MQGQEIYKEILKRLEHLSQESLHEVHLFVDFLQMREKMRLPNNDIQQHLTLLDEKEALHLEDEFEGYKERYPYEK
ncbi:MAG: hypothetical protein KGY41_02910 [Desulfovermiculus sp.]|nr:hypothetical protein [Desulfovermiculus sp.]